MAILLRSTTVERERENFLIILFVMLCAASQLALRVTEEWYYRLVERGGNFEQTGKPCKLDSRIESSSIPTSSLKSAGDHDDVASRNS